MSIAITLCNKVVEKLTKDQSVRTDAEVLPASLHSLCSRPKTLGCSRWLELDCCHLMLHEVTESACFQAVHKVISKLSKYNL